MRKVSPNPALAWLVRNAVSLATSFLSRLLNAGKEPMICSELVFRAYDEALPAADDQYTIHIANLSFEAHGPLVGRERTPGGERGKGRASTPAASSPGRRRRARFKA